MPKMYEELASWWPLLSPVEDYADEAEFFINLLLERQLPESPTLLELGSGGGSNAFYLKQHFSELTLTDTSPQMLAISRELNPECEHLEGDMRTLRLSKTFDVVFIHDAISYMTTSDELKQAMGTAFTHCNSGGVTLFIPDGVRETFEPYTEHGGSDGEGRAMRYLEWVYDPDENDTTCISEYTYVLREDGQPTHVEHEQHLHGLFSKGEWLRLLAETGFDVEVVADEYERDIFISRKQ
ncbi:MAG: class I SAM-dependent methyltransferase [Pseudomonadota bacterium]